MHISSPTPSPGNIPAYAGRTAAGCAGYCCNSKHPRIRGENNKGGVNNKCIPETSPHTRGERSAMRFSTSARGNIPAYAGRTTSSCTGTAESRKHPRIRGENQSRNSIVRLSIETSPHTRGELIV